VGLHANLPVSCQHFTDYNLQSLRERGPLQGSLWQSLCLAEFAAFTCTSDMRMQAVTAASTAATGFKHVGKYYSVRDKTHCCLLCLCTGGCNGPAGQALASAFAQASASGNGVAFAQALAEAKAVAAQEVRCELLVQAACSSLCSTACTLNVCLMQCMHAGQSRMRSCHDSIFSCFIEPELASRCTMQISTSL
jgi:hypothetical protein